jgi:ADP-ribose pyrophosphatase YjhB (NUDIX family)
MTWTMTGGFALFGPSKDHFMVEGGFCMSVFAVIESDRHVLLVKPREHPRWRGEWAPNWRLYDSEMLAAEFDRWRFPSSYIREGEHPNETLRRIMEDQLDRKDYSIVSSNLHSFWSPSRRYPGRMHWDYCFVYRVTSPALPRVHPWLSAARFVDTHSLNADSFGSAQGGLAAALQMLS